MNNVNPVFQSSTSTVYNPNRVRIIPPRPPTPPPPQQASSATIQRPVSILKKRKNSESDLPASKKKISFKNISNQEFEIPNAAESRMDNLRSLLDIYNENPNDTHAAAQIGTYYLLRGEFENAHPYFVRIIEVDPLDISAHLELSKIYEAREDYVTALQYLDRANEIEPTELRTYGYILRLYRKLGAHSSADQVAQVYNDLLRADRERRLQPLPALTDS